MNKINSRVKYVVAKMVLFFLYRGFKAACKLDLEIAAELASWGDGFRLMMSACDGGPSICFGPTAGDVRRYGISETADMVVRFKNMDTAFLVLTGQLSVVDSYIRHGIVLKGNIATAMSLIRCVDKVESYLFPEFIVTRLLNYEPERVVSKARLYLALLTGI